MEQIKVRATESFKIYNHDKTVLQGEVEEGKVYTAYLHKETEEYFVEDAEGREVFAGEVDKNGCLKLEDEFSLYIGEIEHDDE